MCDGGEGRRDIGDNGACARSLGSIIVGFR